MGAAQGVILKKQAQFSNCNERILGGINMWVVATIKFKLETFYLQGGNSLLWYVPV